MNCALLNPRATYAVFLVTEDGTMRRQVAITSGEQGIELRRRSDAPHLIEFELLALPGQSL